MTGKDYRVTFDVNAPEDQAARLRTLLRSTLEEAGFTMVTGVTTVELWLVEATEELQHQQTMPVSRRANDWMVVGRLPRRMGRGPST